MTRMLIDDLLRMLPWLLMGIAFSAWGGLSLWIGYAVIDQLAANRDEEPRLRVAR